MNRRLRLALALLLLFLGVLRGWEAFNLWQVEKVWGIEAGLSLAYLTAAALIWRDRRGRG